MFFNYDHSYQFNLQISYLDAQFYYIRIYILRNNNKYLIFSLFIAIVGLYLYSFCVKTKIGYS